MATLLARSIIRVPAGTQKISSLFMSVMAKSPFKEIENDVGGKSLRVRTLASDAKVANALMTQQENYNSMTSIPDLKDAKDKVLEVLDDLKDSFWIAKYLYERMSNEDLNTKSFFRPNKLEFLVNIPGFQKDDLKVWIRKRFLYIIGTGKDFLGQEIKVNKWAKMPKNCYIEPEEGCFETRSGQLKAMFPLSDDKTLLKKTGTYIVK